MEFVQFPILDRQITLMSGFRCIGTGVNLVLEERARARLEGRPHSARSLGPCPWQASQQGCRLGRAREHDRHAALSRRTARPVIESPATPEAPAGSAHAGPAPVCPSDRRSQPAHTASPPSDLHLGRAVGKGPGRGGGDAVPHTRPGFCVLPLDGFAEREQSSPRPPLRGRRRRLVESPVELTPSPQGSFDSLLVNRASRSNRSRCLGSFLRLKSWKPS
jgi:hypothetical protein